MSKNTVINPSNLSNAIQIPKNQINMVGAATKSSGQFTNNNFNPAILSTLGPSGTVDSSSTGATGGTTAAM